MPFTLATRYHKTDSAMTALENAADSLRTVLELCEAYDLDIHVPELPDLTAVLHALDACRARGDIGPAPCTELTPMTGHGDTGNRVGVLDDTADMDHDWAFLDLNLPRCHRYGVIDTYSGAPDVV